MTSNVISFVRKRSHIAKHVDLFPMDIQALMNADYGEVQLGESRLNLTAEEKNGYIQLAVYDEHTSWLDIEDSIANFAADPQYGYSIWLENEDSDITDSSIVIKCGPLLVPENLQMAAAWALGFVGKNKVYLQDVNAIYTNNMYAYQDMQDVYRVFPKNACRPYIRKFAPWLSGTWIADACGNSINAKVIWGIDQRYAPSYDEVINMLTEIADSSNTESAKARIDYVLKALVKRKEDGEA